MAQTFLKSSFVSMVVILTWRVSYSQVITVSGSNCINDIKLLREHSMVEYFGKFPIGLNYGVVESPGSFKPCIHSLVPTKNGIYNGQYCWVHWQNYRTNSIRIRTGICIPSTCTAEDHEISENYMRLLRDKDPSFHEFKKYKIESLSCLEPRTFQLSTWGKVIGLLLSAYFLLVFSSTYYHCQAQTSGIIGTFLVQFSLKKNIKNLFEMKRNHHEMECLHGLRAITISWIMLFHFCRYLQTHSNAVHSKNSYQSNSSIILTTILTADFTVDVFFVMSSLLLISNFIPRYEKRKGQTSFWLWFYIHRYVRLSSAYVIVIAFVSHFWDYFGEGPYWNDTQQLGINCRKWWYKSLLYSMTDGENSADEHCLPGTWYLSTEMALYVFSPVLLLLLSKQPKIGVFLCLLLIAISIIVQGAISYSNSYGVFYQVISNLQPSPGYFDVLYRAPFCRMGPYIVGLIAGNILLVKKNRNNENNLKYYLGWIIPICIISTLVYSENYFEMSPLQAAFFNAFSRTTFSVCLVRIIFQCNNNPNALISKILRSPKWKPLSRISFCCFLHHEAFLFLKLGNRQEMALFTPLNIFIFSTSSFITCIMIATFLTLFFEMPINNLEKMSRVIVFRSKST